MDTTEINKYLEMAKRRKYWFIIPFLATILVGLGYVLNVPKVYEAQTLILVQAQSVPRDFVRSIMAEGVEDRLRTIIQEVTSRTNLEKIIRDYRLSEAVEAPLSLDAMVERLRSRIKIDVGGGRRRGDATNAFTISFRGQDPMQVMQVTNALASNFIFQNLEIRESQVLGTSVFLSDELETVRKRLADKEEELKEYRALNMGGLPEQLGANLATLQRLQSQMEQLNGTLREMENRKTSVQQMLEEYRRGSRVATQAGAGQNQETGDLAALRRQLGSLEARYTEQHPDVIRLRQMIEKLEMAEPERSAAGQSGDSTLSGTERNLLFQVREIDGEIGNIRSELTKIRGQISHYQARIEETPKRETELMEMNRDYGNLKDLYNSLLGRKLEADISVSMERKQKGEQFRIIDPAKVPTYPVEPDMKKLLLMVLALSFGLGGGLAYFREMMDTSYKAPEELEKELDMKILVSIPYRYTERELRNRKLQEMFKAASVGAGFAVSGVAIVLATKGVEGTMNFLKTLMGMS
jgi:polysaccharide chain length determinant protein (PEP-CTERM system associated)